MGVFCSLISRLLTHSFIGRKHCGFDAMLFAFFAHMWEGEAQDWSEPEEPDRTSSQKDGILVSRDTKGEIRWAEEFTAENSN
jgi:hypothetical protein